MKKKQFADIHTGLMEYTVSSKLRSTCASHVIVLSFKLSTIAAKLFWLPPSANIWSALPNDVISASFCHQLQNVSSQFQRSAAVTLGPYKQLLID